MERLFVYGTLAPGQPNHHVLKPIAGDWQKATLKGDLFDEGWGADLGSPGIVPSDDGPEVEGFLFSSEDLPAHWQMLDEYEGAGYTRTLVTVELETGEQREAFVYALSRKPR